MPVMRSVLFLLFVLATSLPIAAQPLVANPTPASVPGIRQEGTFLTAPVRLDGATLFRIAAPASPQPGQVPIATRQIDVENALSQTRADFAYG